MEKKLPGKYEEKKINLVEFGGFMFGWHKGTIIDFLTDIDTTSFVVLGGDVLKFNQHKGKYEHSYDNWYVSKRLPNESFEEYAARSRLKALEYIQNYSADPDTLFSPTITSEVTAGL